MASLVVLVEPALAGKRKKAVPPAIMTPIICAGGEIRNNKCGCAPGFHAVKVAPDAFRCTKSEPLLLTVPKEGGKPTGSSGGTRGLSSQSSQGTRVPD